jgi:hypothetical protein
VGEVNESFFLNKKKKTRLVREHSKERAINSSISQKKKKLQGIGKQIFD